MSGNEANRITHTITRRKGDWERPWRLEVRDRGRLHVRMDYSSTLKAEEAARGIRDDILFGQLDDKHRKASQ